MLRIASKYPRSLTKLGISTTPKAYSSIACASQHVGRSSLLTSTPYEHVKWNTKPVYRKKSRQFTTTSMNPFLAASPLQYEYPLFDQVKSEHYLPVFEQGIAEHLVEVDAIVNNAEPATFENTVVAMEKSGALINRVSAVFQNLCGSDSTPELRELELTLSPILSKYNDDIYLNSALFARVSVVYEARASLGDNESIRVVESYYKDFVRAGAKLDDASKNRMREINTRMDTVGNLFTQKLLHIQEANVLVVDTVEELDGLDEGSIALAKETAEKKGFSDKYALSLSNTSRHPQLAELKVSSTRAGLLKLSHARAEKPQFSTSALVVETLKLRAEKAALLGYKNWACYRLEKEMAGTPAAALELLAGMTEAVVANVNARAALLTDLKAKSGDASPLTPCDWEFYEEKLKSELFAFDFAKLSEYLPMDQVVDVVLKTFGELYNIRFEVRTDLPLYHADCKTYEVFDSITGESISLFITDYFAREGKSGGAWMTSFRDQSELLAQKPVVLNVQNITKKNPQFVDFDNFSTLFHELGHGVHGMLSKVKYPCVSGTNVSTDYVEVPSTLHEDFVYNQDILENFTHFKTGETIPQDLITKMQAVAKFNQGFDTFEYLSAAIVDLEVHQLSASELEKLFPADVDAYTVLTKLEDDIRAKFNINNPLVASRYKLTYFAHSMGGYSSAYYAYLWSEVFAADGFAYINEGGRINKDRSLSFKKEVLLTGNSRDPLESYTTFRGQKATSEALLLRRGIKN